jgi:hypothetical protein
VRGEFYYPAVLAPGKGPDYGGGIWMDLNILEKRGICCCSREPNRFSSVPNKPSWVNLKTDETVGGTFRDFHACFCLIIAHYELKLWKLNFNVGKQ